MLPRFHPLVRLILVAVGALVVQGVVVAVISAALLAAARISQRPLTDFEAFAAHNQLLLTVLVYPPTLLWLWYCRRVFDGQSFTSLGLRAPHSVHNLGAGALCGFLTLAFLFAIFAVCGLVKVNGFSAEFAQNGGRSVLVLAAYALAFCCVGFTEEVIFRGYVLHNLSAWLSLRAAIWTQAILFGLIHLANVLAKTDANGTQTLLPASQWTQAFWDARWGILNIALIGVFFAQSYLKTGSLWFPIGFHAAWNFALGCLFSLNVSGIQTFRVFDVSTGNATATGGSFGAEGSIFLVVILAAMLWFLQREKNHPQALADLALLNAKTGQQPLESLQDVDETEADQIEAADPTHVSRFRSSMRPVSSLPALKLNRAEFDLAPSQSGFTPVSATTPNSTATTPNTLTISTSIISANASVSNGETATESAVVEVFAPVAATEKLEVFRPEIDTSSTRSAMSEPETPPTPQLSTQEKPATQTPLVELPAQETTTETAPPVVAPQPKKAAPKW